jgi:hypothetical protein
MAVQKTPASLSGCSNMDFDNFIISGPVGFFQVRSTRFGQLAYQFW